MIELPTTDERGPRERCRGGRQQTATPALALLIGFVCSGGCLVGWSTTAVRVSAALIAVVLNGMDGRRQDANRRLRIFHGVSPPFHIGVCTYQLAN